MFMKTNKKEDISLIQDSIIGLMKENLSLKNDLRKVNEEAGKLEKDLILDLLQISDSIQLKIDGYKERIEGNKLPHECTKIVNSFNSLNKTIENIFAKHNIVEINVLNKKAELGACKVIDTQNEPNFENDTVIQVLRKGYKYKDKILRPAEVVISKR